MTERFTGALLLVGFLGFERENILIHRPMEAEAKLIMGRNEGAQLNHHNMEKVYFISLVYRWCSDFNPHLENQTFTTH
jgi:hypothetical protein